MRYRVLTEEVSRRFLVVEAESVEEAESAIENHSAKVLEYGSYTEGPVRVVYADQLDEQGRPMVTPPF